MDLAFLNKRFILRQVLKQSAESGRYAELDSLRGLAALTVFFSHFVMGNNVQHLPGMDVYIASPLHILWDGGAAVTFFFVLSGFVLSLPFARNDRPLEYVGFCTKRVFRLFPAFVVAVLFAVIAKEYLFEPEHLTVYSQWLQSFWKWHLRDNYQLLMNTLFMVFSNYDTNLFDPVIWSMPVELKNSFLVPFMIFIIRRNRFIFSFLFIGVLSGVMHIDFWVVIFFLGVLLAKYHPIFGAYIQSAGKVEQTLLFVSAILLYSSAFTLNFDINKNVQTLIITAGSCLFLLLGIYHKGFSRLLKMRFCRFLGKVSYSFYLIHLPILMVVASRYPFIDNYSLIPVFIISISLSLTTSYVMYRLVEMPFQNLSKWMVAKYNIFKIIVFR